MENILIYIKDALQQKLEKRKGYCPPYVLWTNAVFKELSSDIGDVLEQELNDKKRQELGITVSAATLKRIFKYGYNIGSVIDPRRKKTLDLICIYLGYGNLEALISYLNPETQDDDDEIVFVIKKAIQIEFKAYQKLSIEYMEKVSQYFHPKGPAYKKILYNLNNTINNGSTIDTPSNPSTFQLLSCQLKKSDEQGLWIETKEYCYLKWHDRHTGEYVKTYNAINNQIYLLVKENEQLKVWSNMYDSDVDFIL